MRMFREGVEIIHKMWTEDYPQFQGLHYTIDRPINEPKGVQKPHPSLWIGGGGEQVTLKLVAKYGNASNFGLGDPEVIRQKVEILKRHCEAAGRDYESLVKSTEIPLILIEPGADRDEATAATRELLQLSADEFANRFWVGTAEEIVARLRPGDRGRDRLRHLLHAPPGLHHAPLRQLA
jgi:alkanesulfonate monooxygenase SsuD/methylene tetrahydromethanopterin reductase-like flavin-dependent oxidoreductase (luciferase family)